MDVYVLKIKKLHNAGITIIKYKLCSIYSLNFVSLPNSFNYFYDENHGKHKNKILQWFNNKRFDLEWPWTNQ